MRADDVGLHDRVRAVDGSIDMRLRGKVHDGVDRLLTQQLLNQGRIADIAMNEAVLRSGFGGLQMSPTTGAYQGIEHQQPVARVLRQPEMHEVRADEAGTAGDE
jgi:hypothetical protein